MADVKDFVKGAKQVPFRVGTETMPRFPVKDRLAASLERIGAVFPAGFVKGDEPTNG